MLVFLSDDIGSHWIQIDLKMLTTVTGVITQGRGFSGNENDMLEQWVTSYKILHGEKLGSLIPITESDGSIMV